MSFDDFLDIPDYNEEDDEEFLWNLNVPTEAKRVALYISDTQGNIEDILTDLDQILEYINRIYATYPNSD